MTSSKDIKLGVFDLEVGEFLSNEIKLEFFILLNLQNLLESTYFLSFFIDLYVEQ